MAKEQWETYFDAVRKEDWKAAKNVLQLISKQERNNPQTFVKIGDICQRTGDKSESIAAYTHAAQLLRMQGFAQKALATYKIALRLDPHNPEIISRAEMLMDEFETAKTAPHIPASPHPSLPTTETAAELPRIPGQAAPAAFEIPQTSDWLERTSVSSDTAQDNIITSDIQHADMASLLETTALAAEIPQPPQEDTSEISVPASPVHDTVNMPQSEPSAPEPAVTPPDENENWLESAYEALDTRMFKPEAERPSAAAASGDDDAINLILARSPAEPAEDLSNATTDLFLTPLSERQERSTPEIFGDLPEAMVASFMNELTIRNYQDKEHVIEEGDSGDSMYIIKSGKTRVIAHLLGRELELAVLHEGDVFGEVGFLTGRPRTAAVIADGPVEAYEICRMDIEKLLEVNPEIIAKIEDFYESRVRDTIRKIKN